MSGRIFGVQKYLGLKNREWVILMLIGSQSVFGPRCWKHRLSKLLFIISLSHTDALFKFRFLRPRFWGSQDGMALSVISYPLPFLSFPSPLDSSPSLFFSPPHGPRLIFQAVYPRPQPHWPIWRWEMQSLDSNRLRGHPRSSFSTFSFFRRTEI